MKKIDIESDELCKYIISVIKTKTIQEMAIEKGVADKMIYNRIKILGLKPINLKERNLEFIRENRLKMTQREIMLTLSIGIDNFALYKKILGLRKEDFLIREDEDILSSTIAKASKETVPAKMPRQILSEYRHPGSRHFHDEFEEINEMLRRYEKIRPD